MMNDDIAESLESFVKMPSNIATSNNGLTADSVGESNISSINRASMITLPKPAMIPQEIVKLHQEMRQLKEETVKIKKNMDAKDLKLRRLTCIALKQATAMQHLKSFFTYSNLTEFESDIVNLRSLFETELDANQIHPDFGVKVNLESLLNMIMGPSDQQKDSGVDMKTKVLQLQTKFENHALKLKGMDGQLLQLLQDIHERVKRTEFNETIAGLNSHSLFITNTMKGLAEKEQLRILGTKVTNIEKQVATCPLKGDVDAMISRASNELNEKIEVSVETNYLKKQVYKYDQSNHTQMVEEFMELVNERQSRQLKAEEKSQERMNDLSKRIENKLDSKDFQSYKQWSQLFIHKDDLDKMYTDIIPQVERMDVRTRECVQLVENFRSIIKRTDEAILFRATRMDVEIQAKEIANQAARTNATTLKLEQLNSRIDETETLHNRLREETRNQILNSLKEQLHSQLYQDVKDIANDYYTKLDIMKIDSTLSAITETLYTKADLSDLILMNEQKTHKQNTEKIAQFVTSMHKSFKQLNYSCLSFMKTFQPAAEKESLNSRNQEVQKAITQLEQLFTQMSAFSFQNSLKQTNPSRSQLLANMIAAQKKPDPFTDSASRYLSHAKDQFSATQALSKSGMHGFQGSSINRVHSPMNNTLNLQDDQTINTLSLKEYTPISRRARCSSSTKPTNNINTFLLKQFASSRTNINVNAGSSAEQSKTRTPRPQSNPNLASGGSPLRDIQSNSQIAEKKTTRDSSIKFLNQKALTEA